MEITITKDAEMKVEKLEFDNGKLWIIDGAVPYTQRAIYYTTAIMCPYKYTLNSSPLPENYDSLQWACYLKEDQNLLNFWMGLVEFLPDDLKARAKSRQVHQPNLNYVNALSKFKVHTDGPNADTEFMVYYINPTWNVTWGGETVFFDDAGEKQIYVSQFIPGRIIYGTGDIPHIVRPPSPHALPRWSSTFRFINERHTNS